MATVVNTSPPSNNSNNLGTFLGFALLAIVLMILFFYGLPFIRSAVNGPSISVPDQIDVNINQGGQE